MTMAVHAQTAATLTDLGTAAPTPGAYDTFQLSILGQTNKPDGLNYYTDNQSDHGAGEPGQTFTTGNNTSGYFLNSIAIKTGGGTTSGTGTSQSYLLHVYSVSGGTATLLATYGADNFSYADGDWLQWSGFSLALSPGTAYAYSFGKASSAVSGWEAVGNAGGNLYAGGELGILPVAGGTITFGSSHAYDAVFDLGLTVPNLPTATTPTISLTNNPVYAGTAVTFTEAAGGQTPLYYQWRTDGGGGGSLTNIPGATATNLNLITINWNPGTYHYEVIVSNSFGVSTSSVAAFNLVAASAPVVVSGVTPNSAESYPGGSVTFSATFTGTLPIFYQWQANTGESPTNIPGATNASLTLNNLQLVNNGTYTLLASNSIGGPVPTAGAQLTVLPIAAYSSAVMQAGPVGYWRLNETGSTAGGNLTAVDATDGYNGTYGANTADGLSGPGPGNGFAGFEPVNTAAGFTNGVANSYVTLPQLNLNTNAVTISAWIYPLGTPAAYCGLVFCRPGGDASGFNFTSGGQLGYTWNQNSQSTWSWLSGLVPPLQQWSFVTLVISPQSAIVYLCNTDGIQSATNSITHSAEAFNDSTLIGGDTADGGNGSRTFNGLLDEVAVFNQSLTEQQVLDLFYGGATGELTATPPVISPTNNVFGGTTVTLTEQAFGVPPIFYQWQTNGVNIIGATNSVLILAHTTTAASGSYSVLVSNSSGTNQSSSVFLTVYPPSAPFFTQQPTPLAATNYAGSLITFTASVDGAQPISLQWQHDGSNILNATSSSLTLGGLQVAETGSYTLIASNYLGVTNSQPVALTVLPLPAGARPSVLTYHYDNTRQGANTNEVLLTPANVNVASFGKLFSYPVDGYVYAQPLIMTNLNMPGKGVRNVLFVATMHDSVYAFDADSNGDANGGLLWQTNVGVSSPSPITEYGRRYHSVGNLDVVPEEGMTGTPVIDPTTGTLYVDAFTREVVPGVSTNYFHRIHALNVLDGTERSYSPVVVAGSVPGTGVSGDNYTETQNGSTVTFSAVQHCQRPALTLAGGNLYVAYGSHDDTDPYHGWVFSYRATNLALVSVYCTTPNATTGAFGGNAGEGALWMGGQGLCVDASTNIYFETGNGSFSQNTNGGDYSDSFVKLSTTNGLAVADYFTPYNQASLQSSDADLGSGGPLLLPDSVGSMAHPHLIVGCGKQGKIYLVDRDNMGHFNSVNDNQIVQSLSGAVGGTWSSPAYWNNLIFYHGNGDVLKAFLITNGVIAPTPVRSATSFGFPGATPTVSANGTNNGIVWDIDPTPYLSSGPAVLHAYNATNIAQELYNSSMNLARDNPGGAVKMVPPVIAGGKVYVGAEYAVSVFGNALYIATPTIAPNGGTFTNSLVVTLADTTAGTAIYYTLDGTTPTTASTLYTGPFVVTSSVLVQAIAAANGAVNSGVASASFYNSAALGTGAGLTAEYFANHTSANPFTGSPALVQTNAPINFIWGASGPSPAVGGTNFTVRWTGSVQPQYNETYTFSTTADDGVRLRVNGQLLIDDWVDKTSATTHSNSITLASQQFYNLELDYYQKTNNASVALFWSSPSTIPAVIPQTQLYPYTNPPPIVVLTSPSGNATNYTASASVTITAAADAPYNPVSFVSFYANSSLLGSVSNAPYTLTATGLGAGKYALAAVAVDGSGLSSTSAPVNITVTAGSGQPYGLTARNPAPAYLNMPTTFNGQLPALLSQTGVFSNTPSMTPLNGLVPYVPNTPLWSDNAVKTRYLAVPFNGGAFTPDAQIAFAPTGSWTFPAGTVFVKTFQLNTDASNPNVLRRLETRLLVRDLNGQVYGVTYKWRPDNSDADLLTGSLNEDILITNATGVSTQTWYYPSPADCLTCHTPVANYVLGLNTRQLNGNETYPATGVTDNQLRALNHAGYFNPAFNEANIAGYDQLSSVTNQAASLTNRFRSYIDANCAQCHQPGGPGPTFDARYDTPLAQQNIIYGALDPGADNYAMVVPHDIWRSEMYQRAGSLAPGVKMPPLAKNLLDTNALAMMAAWINGLAGTPALAPVTLTPNGGSYFSQVNVALQAPDTNAVIYFTLNGTLPTTNAYRYPGPLTLTSNVVVSASAYRAGYNNSATASAAFLVQPLQFTSQGFSNQMFQLAFAGVPGSNYVLEASTNLTDWTPLSTNTALTNIFNLVDPKASNFLYRFYRTRQQ